MARKAHAGDDKNIKSVRWDAILELISKEEIGTQGELAERLKKDGYDVTQATVSRDIKELGLTKVAKKGGGYIYKSTVKNISTESKNQAIERFSGIYKDAVIRVECALNQVVIKCDHGMANAVCAAMDVVEFSEIIGSIAGDDTILVITRSETSAKELAGKFKAFAN